MMTAESDVGALVRLSPAVNFLLVPRYPHISEPHPLQPPEIRPSRLSSPPSIGPSTSMNPAPCALRIRKPSKIRPRFFARMRHPHGGFRNMFHVKHFAPAAPQPHPRPLFLNPQPLYSSCRGNPAMAINGRRNKPFGPGGSTRRLHPSPAGTGFCGGELRSTRAY